MQQKTRVLNYSQDSCCINHVVWFTGGSLIILESSYLYVVIREGFWVASARSKVQQNNLQTRWVCYASATHGVTIESFSVFNSRLPSPCWCLNCRRSWPSLDPSAWTWTQTAPWDTTEGSWKRSGDGRRDLCLPSCFVWIFMLRGLVMVWCITCISYILFYCAWPSLVL